MEMLAHLHQLRQYPMRRIRQECLAASQTLPEMLLESDFCDH